MTRPLFADESAVTELPAPVSYTGVQSHFAWEGQEVFHPLWETHTSSPPPTIVSNSPPANSTISFKQSATSF